ncbi:cytochrome d ubiquinol oxidase subunit II [Nonomuraea sp. PA05]|uniref:cytochrome d ubiquinol oxidase subunit II n=1 Tax=Nonomuraea sp. PA05 TaxID=2604466 RepID=UPI0011D5216D|nr:cytochrome d ubiquinol oxidase subunit II [Nonomuraea sp. PA05]TYB51799.1 cytochrome d ubiquinol oxidase subunit II [Nonomuraea sp. PA05]
MELVWLTVVGLLLAGWYALDGFALGAGMFLVVLCGDVRSRRQVVAAVGPFFLANEVWLIAFAGVLAVTFPDAEAGLFTALYPVIVLMVAGWIVRDLGMWFRARRPEPGWRQGWETAQAGGSVLFAVGAGLFVGGAVQSVLSPYAVLSALTTVAVFGLHGAAFLALRTTGELRERARRTGRRLAPAVLALLVVLAAAAPLASATGLAPLALVPAFAAPLAVAAAWWALRRGHDGVAFAGTAVASACLPLAAGALMAGRLLDGAAGESTIDRFTTMALPILPFLLAAQAVLWWVHRHRLSDRSVTFF